MSEQAPRHETTGQTPGFEAADTPTDHTDTQDRETVVNTANIWANKVINDPAMELNREPTTKKLRDGHTVLSMKDRQPLHTETDDQGNTWEVMATYSTDEDDPEHSIAAAVVRDQNGDYEVRLADEQVIALGRNRGPSLMSLVDLGESAIEVAYNKNNDQLSVFPAEGKRGRDLIETLAMFPPAESPAA